MIDNYTSDSEPQTFRRTYRLPWFLIFIPIAVSVSTVGVGIAERVAICLFVVCIGAGWALLYAAPKLTFTADGALQSYKRRVSLKEAAACRYLAVLPGGVRYVAFRRIGIYTYIPAPGHMYRPGPVISIPTTGWRPHDRRALFTRLAQWLSDTDIDVDGEAMQRVISLAGAS